MTAVATRGRVFYGWWVLAVTVLVAIFAAVLAQLFVGVLLPYIEEDTGWSRSSITLAVTVGSISAGLTAPFFGHLADRYGPRVLSAVGLIVAGASLVMLATSGSTHIFFFFAGYVLSRAVGQNTLSGIVPKTTMINWFRRYRGRAVGLLTMAVPLGGAMLIPTAQVLIDHGFSWSDVYLLVAAIMLVVLLPPIILVLRRRPEDMGLLPDGETLAAEADRLALAFGPANPDEYQWTLKEALRTRTMWLMVCAMTIGIFANGAIGFHQFAYFKDQGVASGVAAVAISVYALSGAFASGLWGFLVEKVSERLLAVVTVTLAGAICIWLLLVDTPVEVFAFSMLFGMTARGEGSIITMMEARYFGRQNFGRISGFSQPFQQIALGLGPTIAAFMYEAFGGSYTVAFVGCGILYFVSAVLLWGARQPKPPVPVT